MKIQKFSLLYRVFEMFIKRLDKLINLFDDIIARRKTLIFSVLDSGIFVRA